MKDKRRTRWTDANGFLKEQHSDGWAREQIDIAERSGVPSHWLLVNGSVSVVGSAEWVESGQLDGAWTDLVYELGCCLRGVDSAERPRRRNMSKILDLLRLMRFLAERAGVSPHAIPWSAYEWRLGVYRMNRWEMPEDHQERLDALDAEARERLDAVTRGAWGAPFGGECDLHAHGLSDGVWRCLRGEG